MATGNVVPGAPATAEHTGAGQPVTAEQADWPADGIATQDLAAHGYPSPGYTSPGHTSPGSATGFASAPREVPAGLAPTRTWRGAGGRWLIWVFRAVLWVVLLLVGFRGVAAIVTGQPLAGGSATPASGSGGRDAARAFPVSLAKAFALEFGQAYLNYNSATAAQRASSLAAFLPPGTNPEFGWNGSGTQTLQSDQVASVRVIDAHRAVVTLLARVNFNLIEVAVPVYAAGGGLVVSGQPALLARPSQAVPPVPAAVPQDQAARVALTQLLPAFFRAYASGNALQLRHFTVPGHPLTGLGGVVTFAAIGRLSVPAAPGTVRHIVVTVVWRTAGSLAARPAPSAPAAKPGSSAPAAKASPSASAAKSGSPSPAARSGSPSPGAKPSPSASVRTASPHPRPPAVSMSYALTVIKQHGRWLIQSIGAAAVQPWPAP